MFFDILDAMLWSLLMYDVRSVFTDLAWRQGLAEVPVLWS